MRPEPLIGAQWRRLYEAAIAVKNLAPWEWMLESDVFGFRDPAVDRQDFVSVMGMGGEHLSVAVYLGDRAIQDLLRLQKRLEPPTLAEFLEIPHLQASFEDQGLLEEEDLRITRQLGLTFRSRQKWPMFRSYRPGFFPWFVESDEVEVLICALDQVLAVAPRLKRNPALLRGPGNETLLIRESQPAGEDGTGPERFERLLPYRQASVNGIVQRELIERLHAFPLGRGRVEAGCFPLPLPIQTTRGRPAYPYLLIVIDVDGSTVIGLEPMYPQNGVEEMWRRIPGRVFDFIIEAGARPTEIAFNSEKVQRLLASLSADLCAVLDMAESPEVLEAALELMEEYSADQARGGEDPLGLPESESPSDRTGVSVRRDNTYEQFRRREISLVNQIVEGAPRYLVNRAVRDLNLLARTNFEFMDFEQELIYAYDRCIFDIPWEGSNLLKRFVATEGANLPPEDAAILESMAGAYYSLFEVTDVAPERNVIEVIDLLGDHDCRITDVNMSRTFTPGLLLATRIISTGEIQMTTRAVCSFEPFHKDSLINGLRPRRPARGKKKQKQKKLLSRSRSEYSAYFFRRFCQLSEINSPTLQPPSLPQPWCSAERQIGATTGSG
jgi:hypothetical protein